VKISQKVLGGLLFFDSHCILHQTVLYYIWSKTGMMNFYHS